MIPDLDGNTMMTNECVQQYTTDQRHTYLANILKRFWFLSEDQAFLAKHLYVLRIYERSTGASLVRL